MTTIDWREARADAVLADALVYRATIEQLAELEECASLDATLLAELRPFVGLLRTRHRDLTDYAERLREVAP